MPGDLDGLAVGMALFEQEVELINARGTRTRLGFSEFPGPSFLGHRTIKLSIVSALGFAIFSVARRMT